MERHIMRQRLYTVLTSSVAIFGAIASAGCLQINHEHCVARGGDLACTADGARNELCMMNLGAVRDTTTDGCMGKMMDGFAYVEFGLPEGMGKEGDVGRGTVWGVLGECDVDRTKVGDVIGAFDLLHDEVLEKLDGRSRVRVGSVDFDGQVIDDFNEAVRAARICDATADGASSTTSLTSTLEGSTTDGGCVSNTECVGAEGQFCNVENGQCVSCDEMPEPDVACAADDPMAPLCRGDACVACTEAEHGTCDQQLLVCDPAAGTCGPCTEHDECTSAACDIFVGTCFDPATVIHVGGGGPTIAEGLSELEERWPDGLDSRRGVLVLHEGVDFDEAAYIMDGGEPNTDAEAMAFIVAPGEKPIWVNGAWTMQSPILTVTGMTTRGYLDGVTLRNNTGDRNGWGLRCDGARVDIRRSHIAANRSGGVVALGTCELYIENSFIGADYSDRDAVRIDDADATATILYSTLGAALGAAAALRCMDMADVDVRNSLLVALTASNEVICPSAEFTSSVRETALGLGGMVSNWFVDYANGDYHLTAMAPNDIQAAIWQPGDPTTDIDGHPRDMAEGALDHAGADVP